MAFVPYRGEFQYDWQAKTASQVFTIGAIVDIVSGLITVCTITRAPHSGVIQKTVVSTDADYASATVLPVMIPGDPTSEWKGSVLSTDTLATTDVGNFLDLGGSPVGIDATNASSADDAVLCTKFLGANLGVFRLNSFKGTQPGIGTAT